MSSIVVEEKFRAVRRHIHRRRTLALASFARQTQRQRVVQRQVGETLGQQVGGQSLEQYPRASAGRMDFLARRHVRRAHRARLGFSAFSDSDAFERRTRQSAFGTEVEMGGDFARPIARAQLQVRVERMRIDNHARIHHRIGIEDSLEIAERADQLGPEHHRQQLGARQPVAVLAGERTAQIRDETTELDHRRTERRDAGCAGQVEIDARVNASFAEMSVVGRHFKAVAGEDAIEAAQKRAEPGRRNGGVFGARPTARAARDERARAEPRLANLPDRGLLPRVGKVSGAGAFAQRARLRDHAFRAPARFVLRFAAQLDEQKSAPGGEKSHARHRLDARELGKILIEAFQRFGAMLEQPRRLIRRDEYVVESEHDQPEILRARHGSYRRADDCGERALRANDCAGKVEAPLRHQLVEVVARDAARKPGEMSAHGIGGLIAKFADGRVKLAFAAAARDCRANLPRRQSNQSTKVGFRRRG